jgi:hypothetical protein
MQLFKTHHCKSSEIKCFDCRTPICRECMVVMPNSLVCKKCNPNKRESRVYAEGLRGRLTIHLVALFYGFVGFAFLNFAMEFLGGMEWLAAALLGLGIAEALNRVNVQLSRNQQLPFAILGLIFGATLATASRLMIAGHLDALFSPASLPGVIPLIIVCLAIFFRLRT